jgi:Ni/Co efflux regulator RcnB
VKYTALTTFAAGLIFATAAFAEPHHGNQEQHAAPASAPHGGGGGAQHFSAPQGGPRGGGMGNFSRGPASGGAFERPRTMERAPSNFGAYQQRGPSRGYSNFERHGSAPSTYGTYEQRGPSHGYTNFERRGTTAPTNYGAFEQRNNTRGTATFERRGNRTFTPGGEGRYGAMPYRGGEGQRGVSRENAAYTHGNNFARTPQRGVAQQNYGRDARGFGQRPSNWNERPRDFSRRDYQFNATATERFHWGNYDRPDGWYYRRWGYGEYLPGAFWARDYWLTSWWLFDLAIPPYGFEWVRYGDDALLVNVYTGQILEVEYGVFY